MIQILGIRPYFKKKKDLWEEGYKVFGRCPSVTDLLENYQTYLDEIPPSDRYNIHFTHWQCAQKAHEFKESYVIPFDIDGIDPSLCLEDTYLPVICGTLGVKVDETGAIFTGHGLHLLVLLPQPFLANFYQEMKVHYRGVCDKITQALKLAGLPGYAEPGLFHTGCLGIRMPGTENRKKDKPPIQTRLLNGRTLPVSFDLKKLSGLPDISGTEHVKPNRFFKIDTKAVLAGCEFLKAWKTEPKNMHEPEWYAMLSVVGNCDGGEKLAQEYSAGFDKYSFEATEKKLSQALASSGPRTCANINSIWGRCRTCPNFEKVASPISLKSSEYIETQDSGFHTVIFDKNGNARKGKPCYEDLRKYFDNEFKYKVLGASRLCYTWTGTHYEEREDVYLEAFAQEKFDPYAVTGMTDEFKKLVCRTNIAPLSWFITTTEKKINFKNGVLDLESGELIPHSRDIGFRYVLPYDFDPYAKAPVFEQFLEQITCGDGDIAKLLMEYSGYAFSGDRCWSRLALILIGSGYNGKSTFMHVLRALAGRHNFSSFKMTDLKSEHKCQMMDGKLFNLAEETPADSWDETEYFKNIIAGGDIYCRMIYKKGYNIENKTKFIFASNELPRTKDTTDGFFSRLLIVPFNASFENKDDKEMKEKLLAELPGIFNLVLEGYKRLMKTKTFTMPSAVSEELDKYRMETDQATRWIKERITILPLNGASPYVYIRDVYHSYKTEMISESERPVTADHFGKKLRKAIPDHKDRIRFKKTGEKQGRAITDATIMSADKF